MSRRTHADWQAEIYRKHASWIAGTRPSMAVGDGWADVVSRLFDRMAEALVGKARAGDVLGKVGERVQTYAAIFSSDPDVVSAMQSGDKAAMREVFVRLFKQTSALDPVVGSMEITNSAGTVVMRGHNPEQSGDDKSKEVLVRRALDGRPASGLTVSPTSGEVATDAVHPITAQGKLIGTLKNWFALPRQHGGRDQAAVGRGSDPALSWEGQRIDHLRRQNSRTDAHGAAQT